MGAGPEQLLRAGLSDVLVRGGHEVDASFVEAPGSWRAEIATTFALAAEVANRARDARKRGRFPLLLTGNCMMTLGVVAALRAPTSVVWLDAHGDFNTPETTVGGFIDGMSLAALTGRCWTQLASAIPEFRPVEERRVVLAGARDLDPLEAKALESASITRIDAASMKNGLQSAATKSSSGTVEAHLHVDLDVLDTSEGRVNQFAVTGGVSRVDLLSSVETTIPRIPLVSATLSAYDPSYDGNGRVARIAIEVATAIVRGVAAQQDGAN
jgi:arginase